MSSVIKLPVRQSMRLLGKTRHSCTLRTVHRRMASLQVNPSRAMIDEPVSIAVRGLKPGQAVTLTASVQDDGPLFRSYGHYQANSQGRLDLDTQASCSGTYEGVEPMGPFWSMVPEGGYESGYRMRKKDITKPHRISVALLDGHQDPNTNCLSTLLQQMKDREPENVTGLNCLATQLIERCYIADHVCRVPVRDGRIRGALFIPSESSAERFPGVIDLYGTTGGLAEYRAALLASRGFTVLALAYFNYDDLPKQMDPLDLHYFDEAIDFLHSHPGVNPGGIGVIGISKGAEVALHMSTTSHKVKAVASVNSFNFLSTARHFYNGKTLPQSLPALEEAECKENTISLRRAYLEAKNIDENTIPIEKAKGASLLILQGVDDELVDSRCAAKMALRLRQHGYRDFEVHMYPGTGHLLEPPYLPVCPVNYHSVFKIMLEFGGTPKYHSRASKDSWNRILEFFKEKLGNRNISHL